MGTVFCCRNNCDKLGDNDKEEKRKLFGKYSIPKSIMSRTGHSFELNKGNLIGHSTGNPNNTYTYLSKLGEGSFGTVYKVKHKETGVIRAIKMIKKSKKGKSSWINEEIIKEIELLKSIDHQNIIKIHEFYEADSFFYIVTEYCKGGELFVKVKKEGEQNEISTGIIMFQLFSGINYCHSKNIMHRDLKPENIMIEDKTKDGNVQIKIIDFGTATFYEKEYQQKLIGTAYYIAPEVLELKYNEKCDIWSLGVIMYVLLSGKFPFGGKEVNHIFKKIKAGKYDLVSPPFNRISKEAKDLITKLLELNPDKRISAEAALNHPWFTNNKIKEKLLDISAEDIKHMLTNVYNYNPQKYLQQAAIAYLVHNLPHLPDVAKANCLFAKMDKNNDGILSKEEFIKSVNSLFSQRNIEGDRKLLEEVFSTIDADNSGDIEHEEFVRAAINKNIFLDENVMKFAFDFFDKDKSGEITLDEIKQVFSQTKDFPEQDFQIIIDEVDTNKDKVVDFSEFKLMMSRILN